MSTIEIAGRPVGPDHLPLVIAEIGINHGGDLSVALEMVDAASSAGVEVVKHQTHDVDDEMSAAARNVIPETAEESIWDVMASCARGQAQGARRVPWDDLLEHSVLSRSG